MSRPQKIHQKSIINNKSIVTPLQKTNKQKVDGQKETNWRYQKKIQKLIFSLKKKKDEDSESVTYYTAKQGFQKKYFPTNYSIEIRC